MKPPPQPRPPEPLQADPAPVWKHPQFRTGVLDFAPVAFGIGAWGLMTGVAIVHSGMGPIEMLAMAIFVFAGSSQLAALPLIAAGAPLTVIFATAFCVNLRFVVFSVHLRPYIVHKPLAKRLLYGYLMGDMSYVLLVRRFPHVPVGAEAVAALEAYWLGTGWMGWSTWAGASLAGIALGNTLPLSWGLAFAGILALVGVAASLVSTRLRALSACVAGSAAVATVALPLKLNIVTAILIAVAVCLVLDKARRLQRRRA